MKNQQTFVYICRSGENEELRYSIRSVEKHCPGSKIWVVGEPPSWYDGDYIKVKQSGTKYENAYNNMSVICSSQVIPESFILMNDDFYIVKPIKNIGYYHEGPLQEKYEKYFDAYQQSSYTQRILSTNIKLLKKVETPLSYELHVPFPVEKWKLARSIKNDELLWRSTYGNTFEVGGEYMEDVKVYATTKMNFKSYDYKKKKSPFLSTDDKSFEDVKKNVLDKLFPSPSKYEK